MKIPEEAQSGDVENATTPGDDVLDDAAGGRPAFLERPDWRTGGYVSFNGE